jgi:hypothetical protein
MEEKAVAVRRGFVILLASILSLVFFSPKTASASCSLALRTTDVSFAPAAPLVDLPGFIYVTLLPSCEQNVEGYVTFETGGEQIASKVFSYKANGFGEELWVNWTPKTSGQTTVRITVTAGGYPSGSLDYAVSVDRDTDHDGTGDSIDTDDDNDGVPDSSDQFPLDPSKSADTDKDGVDDSKDSDDDNDGLFDYTEKEKGTNPLKRDTDGDGVFDGKDAFPIDPKRSSEKVQPAPPTASKPETEMIIATATQDTAPTEEGIVTEVPSEAFPAAEITKPKQETTEDRSSASPISYVLWTVAIASAFLSAAFYAKYLKARG